ncbi:MAG TPA: O-antigen ligase family protein [Anaerolineae bacterium]|nr:O-antigen ligase family protein [Anaerolineae bacterium]
MTSKPPAVARKPNVPSVRRLAALRTVVQGLFALSLVLALATHSNNWRVGPLTWLPILHLGPLLPTRFLAANMQQAPMAIGVLTLLPLALGGSWMLLRILEARTPGQRRPWRWGWPAFTWPLLGLTGLALLSAATQALDTRPPGLSPPQVLAVGSLALVWLVYLFVVNEQPRLAWPLAAVVTVQGLVAVAQFSVQRELGLGVLGEISLDPATGGTSVLLVDNVRWLRAYGLTGHPNLLGALLALAMLLLLPDLAAARGVRRVVLSMVLVVGLLGLLATVSRAAWLAFGLGAALFVLAMWRQARDDDAVRPAAPRRVSHWVDWLPVAALGGAGLAFLALYSRQLASRFLSLDSVIEARSLFERGRDAAIALRLLSQHPWQGVGFGNYVPSARALDPAARIVHNAPLLALAELGLPGGLCWAWLTLAPFVAAGRASLRGDTRLLPHLAPWLALVVMSLWHPLPWFSAGWRSTVLLALLMGVWANAVRPPEQAVEATGFRESSP